MLNPDQDQVCFVLQRSRYATAAGWAGCTLRLFYLITFIIGAVLLANRITFICFIHNVFSALI